MASFKSGEVIDIDETSESGKKNEENKEMDIDLTSDEDPDNPPEKTGDPPPIEPPPNTEQPEKDDVRIINPPEPAVIDLDDSDSDSVVAIQETRKKTDCLNPDCVGNCEELFRASGYIMSYFKMKANSSRKMLVCADCQDMILKQYDIMVNYAINHEPVFNHRIPLPQNDCVDIEDSDEEEELKIKLPPDELKLLKREIDYSILDVFAKFKIDTQIHQNITVLEKEYDKIEEKEDELEKALNEIQAKTDKIRNTIYSYKPQTQEAQGIDIDAQGVTTLHCKLAERRSNRKVLKPITYNEGENNQNRVDTFVPPKRPAFVPKLGPIVREPPKVNDIFFAMRSVAFGSWNKCTVMEIFQKGVMINDKPTNETTYRVHFEPIKGRTTKGGQMRLLTGKQLAYSKTCDVRLPIGSRIIALFQESENSINEDYYAGVVAEPLSNINNFRYLIFFDDGYAQYVNHENVNLIVDVSEQVWNDIPIESRGYIQQYLSEYPERPMVKLSKGQVVRTERNGRWWPAKVLQVDGSLVLMYFENEHRKEWIYRGSRRLAPLFNTNHQALIRQSKGLVTPQRRIPGRINANQPYVEYTRTTENDEQVEYVPLPDEASSGTRAVARKSTANVATKSTVTTNLSNAIVPFLPTNRVPSQSRVVYYTTKAGKLPEQYRPHQCGPICKDRSPRSLSDLKSYSMLAQPILAGWYRETVRFGKNKRDVRYVTPCLRIVRNMQELHRYLRITQSDLSVDMFDFNPVIHVLTLHVSESIIKEVKDFSQGQEKTPIPLVNDVDDTLPEKIRYSAEREPTEGVHLNTDEEFLCGCDCTDDCQDKTKCACWQLTLQGTKMGKNAAPDMSAGYVYKRLLDPVVTGIYECNSRCKCKPSTCLNRVVQHPLQLKLQVFKTPNRGWGIRCLHDVPRGAFICIYAGQLLTEATANEGGINLGDEYLAELDYIEVVERLKEGYESDVEDIEEEEPTNAKRDTDEDEDYDPAREAYYVDRDFNCKLPKSQKPVETGYRTRSRRRNMDESSDNNSNCSDSDKSKKSKLEKKKPAENQKKKKDVEDDFVNISDDEGPVRQPSSFIPKMEVDNADDDWQPKHKSVRKMYGADESCYIMDAKLAGNIGRFLNHSCSPNVFVQNVFVDTHDLRFPWVAFFASCPVRAGVELTWNYNYDVGSVPGKIMYCHCGSEECRGRLL